MNRFSALTIAAVLVICGTTLAKNNPERTQFGHEIHVGPGEKSGDSTCFSCSIYVRGQINGDATAFGGRIVVEEGGSISGDATTFGGDIRVQSASSVVGDATAIGGHVIRDEQARIGGDVTSFGGFVGFLIVVALPLLFLAGIAALIVWLVGRNRRASAPSYSSVASTRV